MTRPVVGVIALPFLNQIVGFQSLRLRALNDLCLPIR